MLTEFQKYISRNNLIVENDRILLAISGGTDSVVLLHLFSKLNYYTEIAHCNFKLRGEESDGDEQFVKHLAEKFGIRGHYISFNTREYAQTNKLSIEMAARELRYNWFNELCDKFGFTKIATGHHLNDSIETLFINMVRGTGINGLTGIKPINGNIIRPLLFATREQIEQYIKTEKLEFHTDSSNLENEYVRNIIRNKIIPELKEINPSLESTMRQNMARFSEVSEIYQEQINNIRNKLWVVDNDRITLSITELKKAEHPAAFLFEMLAPMGFSTDSVQNIVAGLHTQPGKMLYSKTHRLLIDRESIIIENILVETEFLEINSPNEFEKAPINFKTQRFTIDEFKLIKDSCNAFLDADKLKYPILFRSWNEGDFFFPLGMNHKKKLSDFFIDQKIDRLQKEKIRVLESNHQIVWIVGIRIDNRFRVTERTKNVLQLTIQ